MKIFKAENFRSDFAFWEKKKRLRSLSDMVSFPPDEIIGLRRSGKSVLLQQIIDELFRMGVEPEQVIFLNFEDFQYAFITDAKQLYDYICKLRKNEKKYYLFFDEIQMIPGVERVISMDKMDFSRDGIIHRNAVEFLFLHTSAADWQ